MNTAIGLFGSSFNPPHLAHFALLHAAREQLNLRSVQVIPAGQPWQKPHVIAAPHRVAMVRAALNDDSITWAQKTGGSPYPITLNTMEADLPQPSYTVETLEKLRGLHPDASLVWIMGSDQLSNLSTWHRWDELLDLCHIAIAQRAGHEVAPAALSEPLKTYYLNHLSQSDEWSTHKNGYFTTFNLPKMHVSSSAIRAALQSTNAENQSALTQLSPSVARYIKQNCLYQAPDTPQR